MPSYVIRRILLLIPTVFFAISFLFFLFFTLPGDPANLIAGGFNRTPDPGVVQRAKERYDLDKPLPVQFVHYWERTLKWDLGESYKNRRSVNDILGEHAVNSLRLGIWAILIEVVVGIGVGLIAALRRYSLSDKITTVVTAGMSALPVFVLGFVLQYAFAVYPHKHAWPEWLTLRTQGLGPDSWAFFFIPTGEQWRYLILPAVTLASVSTALAARMMRGSMLEVLRADYMRTARAKGLDERSIIVKHGLRNALIPVVTLIGIDFGTVIGVAVLTETVFSWPGLGSEIASSVTSRDLPVLLGLTLTVVLAYAIINLLVDLSYAFFDPRIRLGEGGEK
ncbi:MAG: ABC-type dipeptide/oligopeptide/nickel transport system, permease component [Acidimicrobiales bacterium]|nr:ABC-type dipeptide/oligopeptide/nickel transport system, permease component [Acidimicrobiales bacterium]